MKTEIVTCPICKGSGNQQGTLVKTGKKIWTWCGNCDGKGEYELPEGNNDN